MVMMGWGVSLHVLTTSQKEAFRDLVTVFNWKGIMSWLRCSRLQSNHLMIHSYVLFKLTLQNKEKLLINTPTLSPPKRR